MDQALSPLPFPPGSAEGKTGLVCDNLLTIGPGPFRKDSQCKCLTPDLDRPSSLGQLNMHFLQLERLIGLTPEKHLAPPESLSGPVFYTMMLSIENFIFQESLAAFQEGAGRNKHARVQESVTLKCARDRMETVQGKCPWPSVGTRRKEHLTSQPGLGPPGELLKPFADRIPSMLSLQPLGQE